MLNKTQLIVELLNLNNNINLPFKVFVENEKLIAVYKSKENDDKVKYKFILTFDDKKHTVSYTEEALQKNFYPGSLKYTYEKNIGNVSFRSRKKAFKITKNFKLVKIDENNFNTNQIKNTILDVVKKNGWKIKKSWLHRLLGL